MKASFWFLVCAFLQKGISFITTPLFTRLLLTEEYGKFSVFMSWISIATVFVSLNLFASVYTQGLVKFKDADDVVIHNSLESRASGLIPADTQRKI